MVEAMFDRIAPRYDRLNRILTLGLDTGWRRRTVSALGLPPRSLVVDLACGTGVLCRELDRAGHRAVGFDFAQRMLLAAAQTRTPLVRANILVLPLADASVDGLVCGFALRNVVDLDACFAEMARVLRLGGRAALLEVAEPDNPLARRVHSVYFRRIVPTIGGLLSDRAAYRYLPESATYLPPSLELVTGFMSAGFTDVRRESLGLGAAQLLVGTRA